MKSIIRSIVLFFIIGMNGGSLSVITVTQASQINQAVFHQRIKAKKISKQRIRSFQRMGIASYYGRAFHGRRTASGVIFNQHSLTAAHRTLPLGTILRVINVKNHKAVIVKINDRGPFIRSRIIDLSHAAARSIGIRGLGTVKLELV